MKSWEQTKKFKVALSVFNISLEDKNQKKLIIYSLRFTDIKHVRAEKEKGNRDLFSMIDFFSDYIVW